MARITYTVDSVDEETHEPNAWTAEVPTDNNTIVEVNVARVSEYGKEDTFTVFIYDIDAEELKPLKSGLDSLAAAKAWIRANKQTIIDYI